MPSVFTKYRAGNECRQPSNVAEGRGVQRVDTSQFRDASSAGQGSDVVDPPQDQLTVDSIGIVEGPCCSVAKLLSANGKVMVSKNSCRVQ